MVFSSLLVQNQEISLEVIKMEKRKYKFKFIGNFKLESKHSQHVKKPSEVALGTAAIQPVQLETLFSI